MDIWQQLSNSDAVRRQQVAFSCATGLPLTLLPATKNGGSPAPKIFCVDGCMGPSSGKICQGTLLGAEHEAKRDGQAIRFECPAGLLKVLVPVKIGERHIGNLLVGPFRVHSLDAPRLRRLNGRLKGCGLEAQMGGLRTSWHASPFTTPEKLKAVETLLDMFAQYLAECGQRLLLEEAGQQSPLLRKIEAHLTEPGDQALTVQELAVRLHISPCYFCKLFKKQTGLTFTEYRTQMRIEEAKRSLLDPHLRISEVAYKVGFDSIPYFNRAFRRLVGCSPTEFRERQGLAIQAKRLTNQA